MERLLRSYGSAMQRVQNTKHLFGILGSERCQSEGAARLRLLSVISHNLEQTMPSYTALSQTMQVYRIALGRCTPFRSLKGAFA